MSNEYKRATGYYTLTILRVSGLEYDVKNVSVKVKVKDTIQRTQVIRDQFVSWNETFPIRVPLGKTVVSFALLARVPFSPFTRSIGAAKLSISDLVRLRREEEEIKLKLVDSKNIYQRLAIKISFSDVKENATVALTNLLALANDDEEIPLDPELRDADEKIERIVIQGKALIQSKLGKSVWKAIPQVDSFIDTVDNIVKAHPFLCVGWQLVAAAYKVASEQIKTDDRINSLLESAASAFSFAQDASLLNEGDDRLLSLRKTITQLLDQLIECSLFVREYARRNILSRISTQASDNQKIKSIEDALRVLQENLEKGVNFQIGFFMKDVAGAFQSRARNEVLREIRKAFDLTPVMLHDMESSSHQQCMAETRTEWIAEIVAWTKSHSAQIIFWINGIPGSGKSTIAQTIVQHPDILLMLISHIFFKRENTRRHDILKLIAYRLAERNSRIAEEIASRLHMRTLSLRDTFVNLILEPLKAAESAGLLEEPIIIVLDALDEYGTSESRTQLMQLFSNEFADLPRRVRFLITSRPEADLVRALSFRAHIMERVLDVHTKESKRDVSNFIASQMKKLVPEKSSEGPKWNGMMDRFGIAADGLFIWASVAIQLVRDAHHPYRKICSLASNETRLTLDDLYRQALEAAAVNWKDDDERETFTIVFALILPNRGALTVELFDLLLGFEGDSSEQFLFKLQSFLTATKFGSVQIHHKTFADYLLSPSRTPREPWYIDMKYRNSFIARQCLLSMEELHFDMCGAVTRPANNEVAIGDIQPHILYACLYWADHLKGAEFSDDVLKCLDSFLSERLLFWFEILSYMKEFSRVASRALLYAIDWVSTRSLSTYVLLMDANDIISRFPNLMLRSPAFIYTTVLPLTVKSNKLTAQYSRLLKDPMQVGELRSDLDPEEAQLRGASTPFTGHKGAINPVIFSRDTRHIFSRSSDSTIRVWNARTGEAVAVPYRGCPDEVRCIAVSHEERMIVSGSGSGTVQLRDAETGSAIGEPLRGHEGTVSSVAFSPTEQQIASGGFDATIRLWDVESGKPVGKPLTGHESRVYSVIYSPDGQRVVSGSHDCAIRIWDSRNGVPVGEPLCGHRGEVNSVTFSPDGRWVASGSNDKTIRIWDARRGAPIGDPLEGHKNSVNAVSYSADGSRLVSASDDGTVRIWNTELREAVGKPLRGHEGAVLSVAYSRDGSRIVSGGSDSRIIVWEAFTGKPIIGTGIKPKDALRVIADDGSNLNIDDCQFFAGWRIEDGWLIGAVGERRLWLPGYMRKLVRQVDEGLYVYEELVLKNCNGAAEDHKGFIVS